LRNRRALVGVRMRGTGDGAVRVAAGLEGRARRRVGGAVGLAWFIGRRCVGPTLLARAPMIAGVPVRAAGLLLLVGGRRV